MRFFKRATKVLAVSRFSADVVYDIIGVKKSIDVLDNTLNSIENNIEIDLLAIDIKECFDLLGEIIGSTYKDELLDEIFSNFCLGK